MSDHNAQMLIDAIRMLGLAFIVGAFLHGCMSSTRTINLRVIQPSKPLITYQDIEEACEYLNTPTKEAE